MRINKISVENFRGYNHLDIQLDGKDAIFFGINGVGKTSLLRAVDLVFANIIGTVLGTKKRLAELNKDDIYDHKQFTRVELEIAVTEKEKFTYWRKMDSQEKKTHDSNALKSITDVFTNSYVGIKNKDNDGDLHTIIVDGPMPIFVNYGVNRSVIDNTVIESNKQYTKLDAFENAIESRIDFKGFFLWFKQQEDLENELIARGIMKGRRTTLSVLDAVRNAMLSMFSQFSKVRFDRQLNTLVFEKNKELLNISQLSDGEKCTITLFGDIARRLAIANKNVLENPLCGKGIVLIDEVDLHLHPSCQRQIVRKLKEVFPNIQFLITTHSPQVLGDVGKEFSVFSLKTADEGIDCQKIGSLYGWDVNIILDEAMKTPKVNDDILEHTEKMYKAYYDGNLDEALHEADYIDRITNGHNDSVAGIRVLISRKKRAGIHETDTKK